MAIMVGASFLFCLFSLSLSLVDVLVWVAFTASITTSDHLAVVHLVLLFSEKYVCSLIPFDVWQS